LPRCNHTALDPPRSRRTSPKGAGPPLSTTRAHPSPARTPSPISTAGPPPALINQSCRNIRPRARAELYRTAARETVAGSCDTGADGL
jgi:hypothetical protein